MPYLVLARRWRPQTFDDLIGQEHVSQTLQNALKKQRIGHAYLFSGSRGVGKTTTARLLAKALNCQKGLTADPCNTCVNCKSITEGNSLDVIEIDGASNRGIEEIRDLRESIRYLPSQSRYKVIIIDEVHMLTKEAFNALLKTLEEPPPHVIFILATTEVNKIPITILSRCQHFPFRLIPIEKIMKRLKLLMESEENKLSDGCLYLISKQASGSMRDAESLLDQILALGQAEIDEKEILSLLGLVPRDVCYNFVENLINRTPPHIMDTIKMLAIQGSDFRSFARDLVECVRNILLVKVLRQPGNILELPQEELKRLQKLAQDSSFEEVCRLGRVFSELEVQLKESSFQRFALELACLKIIELPPLHSLNELIERLERFLKVFSSSPSPLETTLPSPKEESSGKIMEARSRALAYNLPETQEVAETQEIPGRAPSQGKQEKMVTTSNIQEDWQAIIDQVKEKSNGSLEAVLKQTVAESLNDDTLIINFTNSNSFYLNTFNENRKNINEAASNVLGRRIKVELHSDLLKPKTKDGKRTRKTGLISGLNTTLREDLQKQTVGNNADILKSSLLQEALEIFGGDIVIP